MSSLQKLKVLFLCTGNSCRSQMAEGWARLLKGDAIEPYSAGIETHGIDGFAAGRRRWDNNVMSGLHLDLRSAVRTGEREHARHRLCPRVSKVPCVESY